MCTHRRNHSSFRMKVEIIESYILIQRSAANPSPLNECSMARKKDGRSIGETKVDYKQGHTPNPHKALWIYQGDGTVKTLPESTSMLKIDNIMRRKVRQGIIIQSQNKNLQWLINSRWCKTNSGLTNDFWKPCRCNCSPPPAPWLTFCFTFWKDVPQPELKPLVLLDYPNS